MTEENSTPSVQGERGKKVKPQNGTEPGANSDQVKYKFSGSPTDLFDHTPVAGEVRVMTITVQCTSSGDELIKDGKRHVANWAVRECILGRQTTLREPIEQTATDDDEIADESKAAESQLSLVPEADDSTSDKPAASSGVPDPFNPGAGDK